MAKLEKSTLALTFKFDCDRFLRFRLASDAEKAALALESDAYKRPGIELIKAAGRRWEADKYQDLIQVAPAGSVEYQLAPDIDEQIDRRPFRKVLNLFDILRRDHPPLAIIEGEFEVPPGITPGLQEAYDRYGLESVSVRPDIMWIRRSPTGSPLIGHPSPVPEFEIHIIDVKMAAEPSLRHFTEVTYYALALAAALVEQGLSDRYAVSAEGYIWPGSNDANAFRNLFQRVQSHNDPDPVTSALVETLIAVPYEVYQVHVRQFFEDRLLRVLSQAPLDAAWHVAPKCQTCDFIRLCRRQAEQDDHLSRVPWLNQGQAELLRSHDIAKTSELATAIEQNSAAWMAVVAASHQLRAEAPALLARSRALQTGQPEEVTGRSCAIMPAWSDMNIFISIHFDPGSGITFALGAKRIYFQPGRSQGDRPLDNEHVFIVDRVDHLNPDTERARLIEFVGLVSGWLMELSQHNETVPARQRLSAHIFFWDMLEVRQLRRMIERHMSHPDVVNLIDLMVRLFPPDSVLPDPELFKSQPGTAVKEAMRRLIGMPIGHDYSLLETANAFYPGINSTTGAPFQFRVAFGFETPMSDQIPFERAYELWEDRVFLKRYDPNVPMNQWRTYYRQEIFTGIERSILTRLRALEHIVRRLREHHRGQLTLRKSGFSAAPPVQSNIPQRSRNLIAFERIDVACRELENRQARALPIDEREARFVSIRGLLPAAGPHYDACIADIRANDPRYSNSVLIPLIFSPISRDSRIKERDFLLALSNEDMAADLDVPWREYLDLDFAAAASLTSHADARMPLRRLLEVTAVRLEPSLDPPYLVVSPSNPLLFQFAQDQGLLDLNRVMVLDPLYRDFESDRIEAVLRAIGGNPPPRR